MELHLQKFLFIFFNWITTVIIQKIKFDAKLKRNYYKQQQKKRIYSIFMLAIIIIIIETRIVKSFKIKKSIHVSIDSFR